jgi:hypothetical protein
VSLALLCYWQKQVLGRSMATADTSRELYAFIAVLTTEQAARLTANE